MSTSGLSINGFQTIDPKGNLIGTINVKTYGAKGDGTTDDTTAINNAISEASSTGQAVFFPKGTYIVSSQITLPSDIEMYGAGAFQSTIEPSSAFAGDVLVLSGNGVYVHDIGFNSSAQRTSGTYINSASSPTAFGSDGTIERISFNNGFDNITVNYSTRLFFSDLKIYNFKNSGILVGNVSATNDIYFTKIVSDNDNANQPNNGVHLTAPAGALGANGIVFTDVDFIHAGTGLLIDCPDGGTVEWLFFNQTMFDTCSGDNLLIQDSGTNKTGTIRGIVFNACWFGTSQNNNVETYAGRGISFVGCRFIGAQYNNAYIGQGTNDVSFSGCILASAGQNASVTTANGASIHIGTNVSASVNGCITTVWDGGNAPTVGLCADANSNIILIGNDFSGAKESPTSIDGSATVTMVDKEKSVLHRVDGDLILSGNVYHNNIYGDDIAFGVRNYSQAVGNSQTDKNLGGLQWQINGNEELAEVLHADTDASGNITDTRVEWYSYPKGSAIMVLDPRSGSLTSFHNTLDDGTGSATFVGIVHKNNNFGNDTAFGIHNYDQAVAVSQNNANLGGLQWQINGNPEMAEVMHADTDASGNITAIRFQWYSYSKGANILELDPLTGAMLTMHNTIDDGTGWGHITNGLQIDVQGNGGATNALHLHDTANGAPSPDKYIRVSGGSFQILNSAFSTDIFDIDDLGNVTAKGNLTVNNGKSINVIQASAVETQITQTTAQQVLTYTPTANENFDIKTFIRVATATTTVTVTIQYTDTTGTVQTITPVNAQSVNVGVLNVPVQYITAKSGSPITVSVTASNANDVYCSASIVSN